MDIETRITKKLCSFFKEDTKEGEEILEYGMQLVVEQVFKTIIMLILAFAIGRVKDCLIFLVVFSFVRANAGGKHCMTNLGCTSTMVLLAAASLFLPIGTLPVWIYMVAGVCCLFVCFKWAPSTSLINPITDKKIRIRRKWSSMGLIVFWGIAICFPVFSAFKSAVLVTFVSIVILVILQEITRGEEDEG